MRVHLLSGGNFVDILKGKRKETINKKVEGRTANKMKEIGQPTRSEKKGKQGEKEQFESQR